MADRATEYCTDKWQSECIFYLFNLFAGRYADGSRRRVLFPLAPEYLGYADAGLDEDLFVSAKPNIELLPEGQFKYHVDFEHLNITDDIGLICVSRPTNPTGNVITDEELIRLDAIAQQRNIPLLIDNAYGVPFPGIILPTPHRCGTRTSSCA